jgi:hypothetical protein
MDYMKKYYTYTHSDSTGKVFYVGKGIKDRAWSEQRNKYWKEKVKSLNNKYFVEIVYDELTQEEALDAEALLIELHGFENLTNIKRESPKYKSTLYYNILQNAKMIKHLCEILDNWEYYKKDKFISKQIKDLIFFEKLQQQIRKQFKLLDS